MRRAIRAELGRIRAELGRIRLIRDKPGAGRLMLGRADGAGPG